MKKILLLVAFIFTISCFGQTSTTSRIGLYSWNDAVLIQPCYDDGTDLKVIGANGTPTAVSVKKITTIPSQKFRVIKVLTDAKNVSIAVIQIVDYTRKIKKTEKAASPDKKYKATPNFYKYNFAGTESVYNSLSYEQVNARSYDENQRYFTIEVTKLDESARKESRVSDQLVVGVINFPFKFRPQKGNTDFSGSFNFGAGIGYRFSEKSWRRFSLAIISGYSISNVVLDSSNTNKNQSKLASTNNFTALSLSVGLLVEYQKRVQVGIFTGIDMLSKINQKEFDWQYQNRAWISIGFGLAIFSEQKETTDKNPPQQQ